VSPSSRMCRQFPLLSTYKPAWIAGPASTSSHRSPPSSGRGAHPSSSHLSKEPPMTTPTALPTEVARDLAEFTIEVPSWGYGNSGTRFKVFGTPGTPRDPFEKIADAAQTHAFTGSAPRVSLHYPWDRVDDFGALREYAAEQGMQIGMINSNTF